MPIDTGTVSVTSAGTAVQISSSIASGSQIRAQDKIAVIEVTARGDNTGAAVYFGRSNVSSTYGVRIPKGSSKSISLTALSGQNRGVARDSFDSFYVDADSSNDKVDWVVIW